jgi:hypothetical protein
VIEGAREDIISLSSFLTASAIPFPGSFPVAEPWRLSELSGGWSCKVPGDGSFTVALRSYVANFRRGGRQCSKAETGQVHIFSCG